MIFAKTVDQCVYVALIDRLTNRSRYQQQEPRLPDSLHAGSVSYAECC